MDKKQPKNRLIAQAIKENVSRFIQSTVKPRPSGRGYKARFFN